MFDSVSRLLGFGGVGLASRKEAELWEENRHLRIENAELRCQVGIWRSELEDAQLKISAWKAKADRRADKISELEAEVERLKRHDAWHHWAEDAKKKNPEQFRREYLGEWYKPPTRIEENHGD